jgi:hypothetical protein
VIGTYQRATLIEPMRRLATMWGGLLREATDPAPATEPNVVALANARR